MKLMKFISFFLLLIGYSTSYAHENKYIFIGQNGDGESAKTAFVLEVIDDELESNFHVNEAGEIYLKVDRVVAVPKEALSHMSHLSNNTQPLYFSLSHIDGDNQENYGEQEVRCRNPKCRYYYTPRPGKRDCPRCGTSN